MSNPSYETEGPRSLGTKTGVSQRYPQEAQRRCRTAASRQTALESFPGYADAERFQPVGINPRQNAFRSLSSLRCATEKIASSQPRRPVGDAVPNAPRSTGFDVAIESVLRMFHAGKPRILVLAPSCRRMWLMRQARALVKRDGSVYETILDAVVHYHHPGMAD